MERGTLYTVKSKHWALSHVRLSATHAPAHQAPLSLGCSGQEQCSGLPFSSPGNLPDPGTAGSVFTI